MSALHGTFPDFPQQTLVPILCSLHNATSGLFYYLEFLKDFVLSRLQGKKYDFSRIYCRTPTVNFPVRTKDEYKTRGGMEGILVVKLNVESSFLFPRVKVPAH
jgi:hypothetical protein